MRDVARIVHRPIIIESWQQERPMCFRDGAVQHRVAMVIDGWLEMGEWWNGEGERQVIRVLTEADGVYDIERVADQWFLYRVWD